MSNPIWEHQLGKNIYIAEYEGENIVVHANNSPICTKISADGRIFQEAKDKELNKATRICLDALKNGGIVGKAMPNATANRIGLGRKITARKFNASPEYVEMTRRIPKKELAPIEEKLSTITVTKEFLELVNTGNIQELSTVDGYPFIAMKAFQEGKISRAVFSTILMFERSIQHVGLDKIEFIPLFLENGSVNEDARYCIKESMVSRYGDKSSYSIPNKESFLSVKEIDTFFKRMRDREPMEKQFLAYEYDWYTEKSQGSIVTAISLLGFNSLFRINDDYRMVPSFPMLQTCLDIRNQDQAVHIHPVLAVSPPLDLADSMLEGRRDMALPCPGLLIPKTADKLHVVQPEDYFLHDFYHATACSSILPPARTVMLKMVHIIQERMDILGNKNKEWESLKKFRDLIIDGDSDY